MVKVSLWARPPLETVTCLTIIATISSLDYLAATLHRKTSSQVWHVRTRWTHHT